MCVCSFCHADTAIVRCSPFHGPDFDPCLKWRVLEEFHGCKRFRRHNECWHLKRGWYIGSILGRREPVLTQSETISHWIEWRTSLQKIAEETNVTCQILNFLKIQKIAYKNITCQILPALSREHFLEQEQWKNHLHLTCENGSWHKNDPWGNNISWRKNESQIASENSS